MEFFAEFKELSEKRDYEQSGLPPDSILRNPVCGDEVIISVGVSEDRIVSVLYEAKGCWPVYGCLEWLGDRFLNRNVTEALGFDLSEFMNQVSGIPAGKRHAFSLTHRAFRRAVTRAMMRSDLEPVGPVGPPGKERV